MKLLLAMTTGGRDMEAGASDDSQHMMTMMWVTNELPNIYMDVMKNVNMIEDVANRD